MALLLDTNVITELCKRRNLKVRDRFRMALARGETILLSAVALYEVRRGLYELIRRGNAQKDGTEQLRLLDELMISRGVKEISWSVWDRAATLWAELRGRGATPGPLEKLDGDSLLSAHAESLSATVATRNPKHFREIGIPIEDWGD